METEPTRKDTKHIINNELHDFTESEIDDFKAYNEKVTELDELYASLKPRKNDVILRLIVKDFERNVDSVLNFSKVERLPIASGQHQGIIYDDFPNPYPFTKKAVVVAVSDRITDLNVGDVISLKNKLQVRIGKQDQGQVTVAGGFIHPDYQEDYDNMPQNPNDRHYGYVIMDDLEIELILNKNK